MKAIDLLVSLLPSGLSVLLAAIGLLAVQAWVRKKQETTGDSGPLRPTLNLLFGLGGLLFFILFLPIEDGTKGQLISLAGLA